MYNTQALFLVYVIILAAFQNPLVKTSLNKREKGRKILELDVRTGKLRKEIHFRKKWTTWIFTTQYDALTSTTAMRFALGFRNFIGGVRWEWNTETPADLTGYTAAYNRQMSKYEKHESWFLMPTDTTTSHLRRWNRTVGDILNRLRKSLVVLQKRFPTTTTSCSSSLGLCFRTHMFQKRGISRIPKAS